MHNKIDRLNALSDTDASAYLIDVSVHKIELIPRLINLKNTC